MPAHPPRSQYGTESLANDVSNSKRRAAHRAVASAAILQMLYVRRKGQTAWLSPNWSSSANTWWPIVRYTAVDEQWMKALAYWWCSIRDARPPQLASRSVFQSFDFATAKLTT